MFSFLYPVYQPIVRVSNQEIAHIEALLRLRDDPTGFAHRQLLDVAEKCQFIWQIDLQMLEMVLEDLQTHPYNVAVNLSPTSIDFCADKIIKILQLHPQHKRVMLEITESATIKDTQKLAYFVRAAQEIDVRVAVDDYGNNEGCFTYEIVKLLNPDYVKLDGSVLKRASWLNNYSELYDALNLAAQFGASVIAEFVDTQRKCEILKDVGIHFGQGLLFGAPVVNPNTFSRMQFHYKDFVPDMHRCA